MYFRYLVFVSPLKRAWAFIRWKLESSLQKNSMCKVGWNWLSSSSVNVFSLFHNYPPPPWKRAGPFIWRNLNPLHPKIYCDMFGWNWPSGSGEEDENVKNLQQRQQRRRRRTTDKFWSEKLTWAFGSGELKG